VRSLLPFPARKPDPTFPFFLLDFTAPTVKRGRKKEISQEKLVRDMKNGSVMDRLQHMSVKIGFIEFRLDPQLMFRATDT